MKKRDIDDQLDVRSFDMDEEIDDRNERQGYRAVPARRAHPPWTQATQSSWRQ